MVTGDPILCGVELDVVLGLRVVKEHFERDVPRLALNQDTRSLRNFSVSIGVVMLMEKAFSIVSFTLPRSIIFLTLKA